VPLRADAAPVEEPGWQPVGLEEAAARVESQAQRAASEHAEEVDAERAPEPSGVTVELDWNVALDKLFEIVFAGLAAKDPVWEVSAGERKGLSGAWAAVAQKYVKAPGPLAQAALATALVVVPRTLLRKRGKTVDVAPVAAAGDPRSE
jgi:hypothetical protein